MQQQPSGGMGQQLKNALNTGKQMLNTVAGGQNGQNGQNGGKLGQLKNVWDTGKQLLGGTAANGQQQQHGNGQQDDNNCVTVAHK